MDYKQELMRMQQYQNAPHMPFYMSYPIQNIYMTELEYERDMERMKELYPEEARRIQKLVEEECDKMEYEGSMMFDEYPDRLMLKVICERIYRAAAQPGQADAVAGDSQDVMKNQGLKAEQSNGQMESQAFHPPGPGGPPPGPGRPPGPPWGPPPPPGPPWGPPPGPGRPPGPPWGPPPPPPGPGHPPKNPGLNTLIEVLLYNEMYKRRCRHNRCRRWW